MTGLMLYLMFGLGFYVGLACKDPLGFVEASAAALIRGFLLGVLFWPIGLIVQVYWCIKVLEHADHQSEDEEWKIGR